MPLLLRCVQYVGLLAEKSVSLVDDVLDDFGPGAAVLHSEGGRVQIRGQLLLLGTETVLIAELANYSFGL